MIITQAHMLISKEHVGNNFLCCCCFSSPVETNDQINKQIQMLTHKRDLLQRNDLFLPVSFEEIVVSFLALEARVVHVFNLAFSFKFSAFFILTVAFIVLVVVVADGLFSFVWSFLLISFTVY